MVKLIKCGCITHLTCVHRFHVKNVGKWIVNNIYYIVMILHIYMYSMYQYNRSTNVLLIVLNLMIGKY